MEIGVQTHSFSVSSSSSRTQRKLKLWAYVLKFKTCVLKLKTAGYKLNLPTFYHWTFLQFQPEFDPLFDASVPCIFQHS